MKQALFSIFSILVFALLIFLLMMAAAHGQTIQPAEFVSIGGAFTLEKNVIAGGGKPMNQDALSQNSTAGQAVAGIRSIGGQFSLYSGFWTPEQVATLPTAASVVVGGRILTAGGRGIKNVRVNIAFPSGETRTTVSNAFGYYRFAEIPVGETYVFRAVAKRFQFIETALARNIVGETQDIDFVAISPEKSEL
jgi:hypothetical protein